MDEIVGPFSSKEELIVDAIETLKKTKKQELLSFIVGRVGQVIPYSMAVGIEAAKCADRMYSKFIPPTALSLLAGKLGSVIEEWMKECEIQDEFCFSVEYLEKRRIDNKTVLLN